MEASTWTIAGLVFNWPGVVLLFRFGVTGQRDSTELLDALDSAQEVTMRLLRERAQ
jgi:hypothetical protein